MARLVRTGSSVASLYEIETSFEQVVSDLALAPMAADEEANIRGKLAKVIGRGLAKIELSEKQNPDGVETKNVVRTLRAIYRNLQAAEPNLRGLESGIRHSRQLAVAARIKEILERTPELKKCADEFLSDFCSQMNTVSEACLVAASDLDSMKANSGQKPIDWYDDFTCVLVFIAGRNNIRTTIVTDRVTGKAKGRFLELAVGFERLLYPAMRSPSRGALAKRLSRSLRRIK